MIQEQLLDVLMGRPPQQRGSRGYPSDALMLLKVPHTTCGVRLLGQGSTPNSCDRTIMGERQTSSVQDFLKNL